MNLLFKTRIHLPFERIRDQFNRDLFIYLSPPLLPFTIKRFDGCKKGDEVHIGLLFAQQWISLMTFEETNAKGWSFIDEGKTLPWPLSNWKHHHRVDKISATESEIVDDIHYECSPSWMAPLIRPILWSVFAIRPKRYQKFFKD
ncbi:hypothetical protein [Peredibacter starrii]|uniref:Ligand-binding SRPBCC domain-containing protein n=1 Tax=Peredibacter starrii TaxID=28202 RepID=A0AAX4HLB6_9BACT|nr:hypothetical protein [Peredibacter starrii]WPU63953.1 hypothetical protein SOO65_14755 [Peredibacter starrii]